MPRMTRTERQVWRGPVATIKFRLARPVRTSRRSSGCEAVLRVRNRLRAGLAPAGRFRTRRSSPADRAHPLAHCAGLRELDLLLREAAEVALELSVVEGPHDHDLSVARH